MSIVAAFSLSSRGGRSTLTKLPVMLTQSLPCPPSTSFHQGTALQRLITALLTVCLMTCLALPAAAEQPEPINKAKANPQAAAKDNPAPGVSPLPEGMISVAEVRPGMTGYGMTVFHGTEPEPFTFEVVSVERLATARRAVVWVRCPEPRMQQSGPVQGMSGSPMYIWGENEPNVPGQGGRLLGAFAFGFGGSKDCYVGVQPIEYMLAAGDRAKSAQQARVPETSSAPVMLAALQRHASDIDLPQRDRWRLDALAKATGAQRVSPTALRVPGPAGQAGAHTLALPLSGLAGGLSEPLAPILAPLGLHPTQSFAGVGTNTGPAPEWIDIDQTTIGPGSVFAVPLGFGDLKLAAVGTATHVKDDGTILGFGHAMNASGETSMPVATGYVHMVMPSRGISFKVAASGKIVGTMTRDEASAVVSKPGIGFETAPITVTVNRPGQQPETFNYEIVRHPQYSPPLAMTVMVQSLLAQQGMPMDSTVHLDGELTFDGGRKLPIQLMVPRAGPQDLAFALIPPIAAMAQNPHKITQLTSGHMTMTVENKVRNATIMQGRLDRSEAEPGDTVRATVQLARFGQDMEKLTTEFTVPRDTAPGNYDVLVCDAETFGQIMLRNRPHLQLTESVDDVLHLIKQVLAVRNNQLFTMMLLEPDGIAVGRNEMPSLPSSKMSLIATPSNTMALPYARVVKSSIDLDDAVDGRLSFQLTVTDPDAPNN